MKVRAVFHLAPLFLLLSGTSLVAQTTDEPFSQYAWCLTCHGADGQGNPVIGAPALTGIEPWYLDMQLRSYRGAERSGTDEALEMHAAARDLTDEDLSALGDFVAGLATLDPEPWNHSAAAVLIQAGEWLLPSLVSCRGTPSESVMKLPVANTTTTPSDCGFRVTIGWVVIGCSVPSV